MRSVLTFACAATVLAAMSMPAFAAMDSMAKGSAMMIMSDGQMAKMDTMDAKGSAMMMKHPMKHCVLMMMGTDGKMYMTTETDKACGDMAKGKM